jgi:hypothetical protein
MAALGIGVIARYGNWYRADDDLFTHCLILKNGECLLLGQSLQQVSVRIFKAPIPAAWPSSSYSGYNFITNAESSDASEIAVYGKKAGGTLAGYFVPPVGSVVETRVKQIAHLDA